MCRARGRKGQGLPDLPGLSPQGSQELQAGSAPALPPAQGRLPSRRPCPSSTCREGAGAGPGPSSVLWPDSPSQSAWPARTGSGEASIGDPPEPSRVCRAQPSGGRGRGQPADRESFREPARRGGVFPPHERSETVKVTLGGSTQRPAPLTWKSSLPLGTRAGDREAWSQGRIKAAGPPPCPEQVQSTGGAASKAGPLQTQGPLGSLGQ